MRKRSTSSHRIEMTDFSSRSVKEHHQEYKHLSIDYAEHERANHAFEWFWTEKEQHCQRPQSSTPHTQTHTDRSTPQRTPHKPLQHSNGNHSSSIANVLWVIPDVQCCGWVWREQEERGRRPQASTPHRRVHTGARK